MAEKKSSGPKKKAAKKATAKRGRPPKKDSEKVGRKKVDKKEPVKMGRPRIEFTERETKTVAYLASIGSTHEEIALALGVSVDTVADRIRDESTLFSQAYKRGRYALHTDIRKAQIDLMKSGDKTMAIYLGKVILRQNDQPHRDNEKGKEDEKVVLNFDEIDCTP